MKRILLVDDERHVVDWLYELIEGEALDVELRKAYSGTEALRLLQSERVDLVVSDITMPGISGLELLREIYSEWPFCRVILLTGHRSFDYIYESEKYPDTIYLMKTEDDDVILGAIRRQLEGIEREQRAHDALENEGQRALLDAVSAKEHLRLMMDAIKDYVSQHLGGDLSLGAIAERVNYNPSYVSRAFKQLQRENLSDYIARERIEAAKRALAETGQTIGEISQRTGFGNAQYFATVFRKQVGLAPHEYRERIVRAHLAIDQQNEQK